MSAGTTLSRITGFLRLSVLAATIGVFELSDTYNTANTTPNIVYELVLGGILTSIFVPVFVEWLETRGREEAWEVAERVLTVALVSLVAIAIVGAVLAPEIMRLYLSASHAADREAQIALGAFFLRWFMPQIVFYGVGAVATGLLNAHRRFAAPMFAPILNNLVVIATGITFALIRRGNPVTVEAITGTQKLVLAIGTTAGVLAMTAALWPSLRKLGFRWRWRLDLSHPAVRRLGRLALWVMVYVVANQTAYLIVIILARRVGNGAYTAYSYAFIVFQLPYAIFAVSIFTALVPDMSGRWAAGDQAGVRRLLSQGVRATAFIVLPAATGYIALAGPIARLIFEHGETRAGDTAQIAAALQGFALGLVFFSTFQLVTRAFYAMQDSRTPALVNMAAAIVNIAVDLFLVLGFHVGVRGLALGHATSYLFSTLLGLWILRRRLEGIDGTRILSMLARVLPAAIASGLAAWSVAVGIAHTTGATTSPAAVLQVVAGVGAGLLVYVGATLILRMNEIDDLKGVLVRRFRR